MRCRPRASPSCPVWRRASTRPRTTARSPPSAGDARIARSTIAVIGTGPDRVYPASHRALAHAIAARGALVTEFAPGTPPLKGNFPRRNRLITGLARGVLVVEATPSSGSLITARLAVEQGRDVFAIPGSIHSPLSRGRHKLIRDGAKLIETAQDMLAELGTRVRDRGPRGAGAGDTAGRSGAGARGRRWAAAPVDLDRLVARTGPRARRRSPRR